MDKRPVLRKNKIFHLIASGFIWMIVFNGAVGASDISDTDRQTIQKLLTQEEKLWLSLHGTIRISGPKAFPPFHYFEEDGTLKGMASDYIHLIFKYLDIQPDIQSNMEWAQVLKAVQEKKIDLILCAAKTMDREAYLGFSEPYLSFPLVIIAKTDAPFIGGLDDLHGRTDIIKWSIGITGIVIAVFVMILMWNRRLSKEIHERRLAEEALKKSKEELNSIFRAAPTGIGLVYNRVLQQVNDRICEMTGYSREELIGKNARILYPTEEEYHYVGREKYRQIGEYGTGTVETFFKRKDGRIIAVLMSSTPLDPTDLSAGVTFTALDVTERKQTEVRLRKSEERYREYFEENISGSYISSPGGKLIACNKEYMRIFGLNSMQQALDTPIIRYFMNPGQRAEFLKILKNERRVTGYELVMKKIDGTPVHLIENASGVFDDFGKLKHIRGFLLDVTDKRRLEVQLLQAQRMEAIGTLAGGIAHDFNNILFPVLGHTEILLGDIPEGPIHDRLKKIYNGAIRARDLVKQILTFSRQDKFELIPMELQPIVKEALKFIRSTIPATIEIVQDISTNCGAVKADATQIHQIIMNLTTNAYHAMDETGGELKVTLKQVEIDEFNRIEPEMRRGRYVCLTVADTGIGMDKELKGKIFDPFFTTKEKGKGTGMGLAVVHGIVTGMNGIIQVVSEPGKGTAFNVYFPAVEKSLENHGTQDRTKVRPGTERILIVDDEDDIVAMEKQILENLGYQVSSFNASVKALEVFRAGPDKFDIVITDMAMPAMSGDRLAAELIKIRPDIPILLCTGFSETMSEEKVASLGIKGLILKPITKKELGQKIRDVLDADRGKA